MQYNSIIGNELSYHESIAVPGSSQSFKGNKGATCDFSRPINALLQWKFFTSHFPFDLYIYKGELSLNSEVKFVLGLMGVCARALATSLLIPVSIWGEFWCHL